jgi:Tfp pilus assembly PilM family ATPase
VLQWDGKSFTVRDYAFLEAPGLLGTLTRPQLVQHLRHLAGTLSVKCREAALVLGMHDTIVRTVNLPNSAETDLRTLLKLNTSKCFKAESSELVVDCVPLVLSNGSKAALSSEAEVVAVAVAKDLFRNVMAAASDVGLRILRITSVQVGLSNAVRLSRAGSFQEEVMALVDLGPRTCTITALIKGQPALSRVVDLDDALCSGLDEAFATPYPVAAEIRTNLIRNRLQKLLFPVGRDISAAIDFFEARLNCRINAAMFTGGTERAELMAETLQAQLDVPCHRIDASSAVTIAIPAAKAERATRELPRVAGSIGVAAACYLPEMVQINLLADQIEARARRRRDPVRLCAWSAAAAIILMLAWAGYIRMNLTEVTNQMATLEAELKSLKAKASDAAKLTSDAKRTVNAVAAMEQHATNRFLFAPVLNALQQTGGNDVQVIHVSIQQATQYVPGVRASSKGGVRVPAKRGYVAEKNTLLIQAKNFADPKSGDAFLDEIATQEYFQTNLRKVNPVLLKNRMPRQVDPLDPDKTFTLFTIECSYPERILGYE